MRAHHVLLGVDAVLVGFLVKQLPLVANVEADMRPVSGAKIEVLQMQARFDR
jgi:hypothetical protein